MKKLYLVKVRSTLQIPNGIEKEEFLKLIEDDNDLVSNNSILVSSEDEDSAIVDALCKYLEDFNDPEDLRDLLTRGELRHQYYLGIAIEKEETVVESRILIELFPEDLRV